MKLSWFEPSSVESVSAASSSTEVDSCSSEEGSAQLEKCGPLPSGSGAALIDARPLAIADSVCCARGIEVRNLLCRGSLIVALELADCSPSNVSQFQSHESLSPLYFTNCRNDTPEDLTLEYDMTWWDNYLHDLSMSQDVDHISYGVPL